MCILNFAFGDHGKITEEKEIPTEATSENNTILSGNYKFGESAVKIFKTVEKSAEFLDAVFEKGIQCLNKLGTTDAKKNAADLQSLQKSKEFRFTCGALGPEIAAQGEKESKTLFIDPGYLWLVRSDDLEKTNQVAGTSFHEMFHILGYEHGEYEFAYSCQACCFPSNQDSTELKEAACSICAGNDKKLPFDEYAKKLMLLAPNYTVWTAVEISLRKKILTVPMAERPNLIKQIIDISTDPGNIPRALAYGDVLEKEFGTKLFRNPDAEKFRNIEVMSPIFYPYYEKLAHAEALFYKGETLEAAIKIQELTANPLPDKVPEDLKLHSKAGKIIEMFESSKNDLHSSVRRTAFFIEQKLRSEGSIKKANELNAIFN